MVEPPLPLDDDRPATPPFDPVLNRTAARSRFLVLRNRDGARTAVARTAVIAVSEADDGSSILLLPAGRMVHVAEPFDLVVAWL